MKEHLFEIKPKSVCAIRDEGFDENPVSTSRKKLLPLAGIFEKLFKKMVSTSRNNALL